MLGIEPRLSAARQVPSLLSYLSTPSSALLIQFYILPPALVHPWSLRISYREEFWVNLLYSEIHFNDSVDFMQRYCWFLNAPKAYSQAWGNSAAKGLPPPFVGFQEKKKRHWAVIYLFLHFPNFSQSVPIATLIGMGLLGKHSFL